uniref:Secreted protein n=1 Tax=Parascaris equorum TaxID=6256 RepID=A0A914S058_PAREQ
MNQAHHHHIAIYCVFSYACSLALSSTQSGNYGPFFDLKLPPKLSELTFEPLIDEMQPQIFPEHPLLGHTAYLECFAYGR